jgi:ATP-binding cassette subfamily B protein
MLKVRARRAAVRLLEPLRGDRAVLELVRLLPKADRWGTVGLGAQVATMGLAPLAVMLASGALIAAVSDGRGVQSPWPALSLMAAVFVTMQVVVPFLGPVTERLATRLEWMLRGRMLSAVLAPPTIAHLEDPSLADELAQSRAVGTEQVESVRLIGALSAIGAGRLLAASSAVVLASYRWWAPLGIVGAWMVSNRWYRREAGRLVTSLEASTPGFRRARYSSGLALEGVAAKELRIFGMARWLAGRFEAQWRAGVREAWASGGRSGWRALVPALVLIGGHGLVLGMVARSGLSGEVGLGQLAVYLQAALGMAGFGWDADNQYLLRLGAAPLPHARALCEATASPRFRLPGSGTPPGAPQNGIRFEGASFAYPGTDRDVLSGLDLWIPAGRSLAIVGENGSGKTTLLKLLSRFYDPSDGRVSVDGLDLRKLDAAAWQRRIAAVFQDFARYPLPARDNVAFGSLARAHDPEALQRAAALAGLADVVERLPSGWDTPLSRELEDGVELSGGQWQRVALARVLFAIEGGARILLLDEPTANLDIRAEAEFYDRFLDLTRGLTAVVVSHRFSSVRLADHIVVLERGRVVEAGSHDELIELDGRYAAMFNMQAAVYRQSADA